MDATELLQDVRLMPVVAIGSADTAVPLARTLLDAGIGAIEVTLRTDEALWAIEQIAREVPEILLGAGSIRYPEQFAEVQSAGAVFAVSPGSTDSLIAAANMPYLPGAATASECLKLLEYGYRLQKFFPAEANGGASAIASISAPVPEVRFCPTGGINLQNVSSYLETATVACIGGSWFVPSESLSRGDFALIERECREAAELIAGYD